MHIHILGICGTFMGGLAALAREAGHRVTGSDASVYPPMSTLLASLGIDIMEGYAASQLQPAPDVIVVGNAMTRGNPAVEYMLDAGLAYTSGPQWLSEHVLRGRHVLAVAGTHGKTTTTSMLAWILEAAGAAPGFLVGGVPANFGVSARLGEGVPFVIEADEYDTAFFDKRSKFLHYRPRTLILNNLEFDHADIFPDLAAIQRQVHHVVRIVPASGTVLVNAHAPALEETLAMGCWSPVERFGWQSSAPRALDWCLYEAADGAVSAGRAGEVAAALPPSLYGRHNAENALAAIAAAAQVGVPPDTAVEALAGFAGVARRLERLRGTGPVPVYDDFAHHPTAIRRTLEAVRGRMRHEAAPGARLVVAVEPRSNTMRLGSHGAALPASLAAADEVWLYAPPALGWNPRELFAAHVRALEVVDNVGAIASGIAAGVQPGDFVVLMSNGGFGGLRELLRQALADRFGGTA